MSKHKTRKDKYHYVMRYLNVESAIKLEVEASTNIKHISKR